MTIKLLTLLSVLVLAASVVHAEPVRQPSGIEPGEGYRLVFVTSETRDARSSDIEDYNTFVQGVADAAPVVGAWGFEWKAIASTRSIDALDNINVGSLEESVPVYRVDGELFASSYESMFGGASMQSESNIGVTEFAVPPKQSSGFTGAAVWLSLIHI